MHGSILLRATRESLPGLRRLQALVLTTVSAKNPCSPRYVVKMGLEKSLLRYQSSIIGFSFLTEVQSSPSDAVNKSC